MNDSLTTHAGTYNLAYKDQGGSLRKQSGLAPSLSSSMTIKSQPYVDASTKVPGVRTVLRFDRNLLLETGGQIAPLSAYLVVARPNGSLITTTNVRDIIREIVIMVGNSVAAGDQAGKDQAIYVDGEQ